MWRANLPLRLDVIKYGYIMQTCLLPHTLLSQ